MNLSNKNVVGNLETKYRFTDYGIRFSEKWNTDNILSTEIALEEFCKAAKITCETTFKPKGRRPPGLDPKEKWSYGEKSLRLKGDFKNSISALNLDSEFRLGGPLVRAGLVMGYGGCVIGGTTAYDTIKKVFQDSKVSMGFITKDFTIMTAINSGEVFTASVHHLATSTVDTGMEVSWTSSGKTSFAIGCRYSAAPNVILRVKLDSFPYLSFGYSHKVKDGINISVATQLNGQDYSACHKVGFVVELEG